MLIFYTSKGILKIQLFGDSNPVTVANFISKVKSNIYTNKNFYRVISYSNNKLIYNGLNKSNDFEQIYNNEVENFDSIPLEVKLKNREPIYETPITNPLEIKNLRHKFEKGSLSMVKINNKRSSGVNTEMLKINKYSFDI